MVIVTQRHLAQAATKYPDAAKEISSWVKIAKAVRWRNMPQVVATFKDADEAHGYTIFNIRRNRYRLITVIHFPKHVADGSTQGHIYVRSFLTHKEYDNPGNWDKEFGS